MMMKKLTHHFVSSANECRLRYLTISLIVSATLKVQSGDSLLLGKGIQTSQSFKQRSSNPFVVMNTSSLLTQIRILDQLASTQPNTYAGPSRIISSTPLHKYKFPRIQHNNLFTTSTTRSSNEHVIMEWCRVSQNL